jgi:branched-chain amino acid transport system permease protein
LPEVTVPELDVLLFLVVDGLIWGCIIALIALGLSLIFGIMRIINMAHGDLFMLGAVLAVIVSDRLESFWPAVIVAPAVVGLASMPVERWILRPFEGRPLATMVGTLGLSFIIQQSVLMTWGGTPRRIFPPVNFVVDIAGVAVPGYRLVAAGVGVLLLALLWGLVYATPFGLRLRATIDQPEIADAMGIDTSRIRVLTFALGAALAGAGGVLAAPIRHVFYLMGLDVLLFSFIVVIVGGLGSLGGTLIAALALSGMEGLLSGFFQPVFARILILLLMAGLVVIRPRGLFG